MSRAADEEIPGVAAGVAARAAHCRRPRADARRNRARVIAVARAVFSERGPEARMEEIAARAGVGVGTLYRNFPTKEALLGELLAESLRGLAAASREALTDADTWGGFARVMRLFVQTGAANRSFERAMRRLACAGAADRAGDGATPSDGARGGLDEARDEFRRSLGALVERAQAAGMLRPDVTEEEVLMLFRGISHARPERSTPERQERCVRIILDGLRRWPDREVD